MVEQKDKARGLYIDTGDFGATYIMVRWALAKGLKPYMRQQREK